VLEFEDRLDVQIEKTHEGQIKQTYVRFEVLDTDENGKMTFSEYMVSGLNAFHRYDTNGDGYLTLADPAPAPVSRSKVTPPLHKSANNGWAFPFISGGIYRQLCC